MKVRTVRKHSNGFKPVYVKNIGRKYELPDRDGNNLIIVGHVVADTPDSGIADEDQHED